MADEVSLAPNLILPLPECLTSAMNSQGIPIQRLAVEVRLLI